jgi:hypothetical protein
MMIDEVTLSEPVGTASVHHKVEILPKFSR